MTEVSIVSIVATGTIDAELDLDAIYEDIESYSRRYDPGNSPGLYIKFYDDGPTITIYRTGSFNIRGADSHEELNENEALLRSRLSELNIDLHISEFKITNIVYTAKLDMEVNLNHLAVKLGLESVEYEPEQFPGMVYRVDNGVLLIFSSGKLVLTGFTKTEDAEEAYHELVSELDDD